LCGAFGAFLLWNVCWLIVRWWLLWLLSVVLLSVFGVRVSARFLALWLKCGLRSLLRPVPLAVRLLVLLAFRLLFAVFRRARRGLWFLCLVLALLARFVAVDVLVVAGFGPLFCAVKVFQL
jgi:hypothetical protein